MNRKFSKTIEELKGLITEWSASSCKGVLLAVSGGMDSMCMAGLFAELDEPLPFAVAHCNFHLRGEESDGDEELVRAWAEEHGVELHVRDFDTVTYAHERGVSIEMAARDLRYAWFEELCREYGYCAVAVAHNSNDNAETLVLNLLRGSGMNGLSGMSPVSRIPSGSPDAPYLIRPLLSFTRKQIEGHVYAHKWSYRDDSTNASSDYKRNRIRNEAFPVFETINPSFIRTLKREMENFTEAGEIVTDYCRALVPSLVSYETAGPESAGFGDSVSVDLPGLMAQKHWRYLLYFILEPYGFNSATLSSIEDLLASSRTVSGKAFLSSTHELKMERNRMIINSLPLNIADDAAASRNTDVMPVRGEGMYHFNGRSFKVEVLPWTSDMPLKQPADVLVMDAAKLKFPFVLRTWRSGDWFIPFGMKGKKKVSDLFADLKFTSLQKRSAVLLIDTMTPGLSESQHIAALACTRQDDRYKVTPQTGSVVKITEKYV